AANIGQLIVARAAQGLGAALLVPGSLAIISSSFPVNERGRAIGTWSGFSAITTAIGPVMGGWLIEHVSWRAVFFINVPIALLVILISLRSVPESFDRESKGLDWWGAILGGLGFAAVYPNHLSPFALGGRARRKLRAENSAGCRPTNRSSWIRAFYVARGERWLLAEFFSCCRCTRYRHGGQCRASYHYCDEFNHRESRRHCIRCQ